MSRRSGSAVLILALAFSACSGEARRRDPKPEQALAWRTVGSWSGRGNRQTESFTSDTGALRVRWTTTVRGDDKSKRTGAFRVTAHSAISGRILEQAVDQHGAGSGVGYVNQDPHVFYLMVESDSLDWALSVEEAIAGTVTGR